MLKQIGGVILGVLIGFIINDAIASGAASLFPEEFKEGVFGFGLWGSHNILRVFASIVGTAIGSLCAGCISEKNGRILGTLSSLPTCLFWVILSGYALLNLSKIYITIWNWIVIASLIIFSPLIGYYFGNFGEQIRRGRGDVFDKEYSILGITWYHWIWLIIIVHISIRLAIYNFYLIAETIIAMFSADFVQGVKYSIIWTLSSLGLILLYNGLSNIFNVLMINPKNYSIWQKIIRIIGWILGAWIILSVTQIIAYYLLRIPIDTGRLINLLLEKIKSFLIISN